MTVTDQQLTTIKARVLGKVQCRDCAGLFHEDDLVGGRCLRCAVVEMRKSLDRLEIINQKVADITCRLVNLTDLAPLRSAPTADPDTHSADDIAPRKSWLSRIGSLFLR